VGEATEGVIRPKKEGRRRDNGRESLRRNTNRVYDRWVPLSGRTKIVAETVLALILGRDLSWYLYNFSTDVWLLELIG
jgi:hypothetical protein